MGHYYDLDGTPKHFVEMTSRPGELRPTRVTDARKHGWVPSVTTIMDVLAKHALVGWKIDQHLAQAYRLMQDSTPDYSTFLRQVKDLTELEMNKAPDAGTNVHNILEQHFLGNTPKGHETLCNTVSEAIIENCGDIIQCDPEAIFVSPEGYAGCIDLPAICDDRWIIDYKTKQTAEKFKPGKMAYPDHSRQLAAYREGYQWHNARCANLFICIETGEVDFHEHSEDELNKGFSTFLDCLSIWKRENYTPNVKEI